MEKFSMEEGKFKNHNKLVDVFYNNKNQVSKDAQVEIIYGDCSLPQATSKQVEDEDFKWTEVSKPVIVEMKQASGKQKEEQDKIKAQHKFIDVLHKNKKQVSENARVEIIYGDCSLSQNSGQQAEDEDFDCVTQQPVIVEMQPQASSKQVEEENFAIQQPIIVEMQQQQDRVCIQHLAQVEKLSEGQKFLRYLLKVMREEKVEMRRKTKVTPLDLDEFNNLDQLYSYDIYQGE